MFNKSLVGSSVLEVVLPVVVYLHVFGSLAQLEEDGGGGEEDHEAHIHVEARLELVQRLVLVALVQHKLIRVSFSELRKSLFKLICL